MNDKNKKESIIDDKNLKAKKQKILQQRVKNKKIISDYLCKINFFLLIKFGIIFLLSTTYYITSLLIFSFFCILVNILLIFLLLCISLSIFIFLGN